MFDKNVNVSVWCCYSLDTGRTLLVTLIIVGIFKITLLSDKMSVITPKDFNPKVAISCLITRNFRHSHSNPFWQSGRQGVDLYSILSV